MTFLKENILPAIFLGIISGSLSAAFLWSLEWVSDIQFNYSRLYLLMIPAGLFIIWIYHLEKNKSISGNALIQASYRNEEVKILPSMIPLIWLSTLLTHLTGGSAGREGTAVQMSVGQISWFSKDFTSRKKWINAGIAAGFSGVFGTPIAAIVFAFEYVGEKERIASHIVPVFLASVTAHLVCLIWGIEHAHFLVRLNLEDQGFVAFMLLLFGIIFFLLGMIYKNLLFRISDSLSEIIPNPFIRISLGALVICTLYYFFSLDSFRGLSLGLLNDSFESGVNSYSFLIKLLLTILTLSFGFKGGDVTPLFVIGACLGSALAEWTGIPISTGAAAGMITVFASVYRTPLAGVLLFVELFGWLPGITCAISMVPAIVFFEFSRGLKF